MSIVGFCGPLLSSIVLAGVAVASMSVAHAAPDACALLTVAQVSAAVGNPVTPPVPSVGGDGSGGCRYGYGTLDQVGVDLYQLSSAAEAQKKFSDDLQSARGKDKAYYKVTVESGVGDGAFSTMGAFGGTMKIVGVEAVRGSRVISIGAMSDPAVSLERLRALMLTALSR